MRNEILSKLNQKIKDPREQMIDIMIQGMHQMSLDVFRKDNEIFLNTNLSRRNDKYSGHNSYCKVFKRDIHFIFQEKPAMYKPSCAGRLSSFKSEIDSGEKLRRFNGSIVPKSKYKYENVMYMGFGSGITHHKERRLKKNYNYVDGGAEHCILFTPSKIDHWLSEHNGEFNMEESKWWHEYRSIEKSKIIGGFWSDDVRYHGLALAAHEFAHIVVHEIRRRMDSPKRYIHPRLINEYKKSRRDFEHKYSGHKRGWQHIYGLFRKKYVNPFVHTESVIPKSIEQIAAEDIRNSKQEEVNDE